MMSRSLAHHPAWNMRQRSVELVDDEHVRTLETLTPNDNRRLPTPRVKRIMNPPAPRPDTRQYVAASTGSGKSTFVNFVALCMAGEMLGVAAINLKTLTASIPPKPDSDQEPKPQQWDHGALLPVPVVLRDFASELPTLDGAVGAETVWRHIEGQLKRQVLGDFAPHLRDELLKRGGLILLDGLDEVPDPSTRREQVKRALQDFADTFAKCRFLVTSRIYAHVRQDWRLTGFAEVALLPFTRGQVRRFVDAWYAHMSELERPSESDAKGRAAQILERGATGL